MEINIKPEDIDVYVKEAILKSTIGKTFSIEIDKAIQGMFNGWNNPIKKYVEQAFEGYVKEYLEREDVKPLINEAIAKWVSPEIIKNLISEGCQTLKDRWEELS